MTSYVSKLSRVRATSATGSFPSKVPTSTAPTGAGVVNDPIVGDKAPDWVQVIPFGDGADNATFDLRVIGWKVSDLGLWVPTILAQAACILSSTVGSNTFEVTASQRFADTITLTQVIASSVDSKLSSPTGELVASFQVETRGCVYVEVTFNLGTATGANALVSWV